ncbi:hypothetical protein Poly59_47450 [Rubripirellula reticaptiva]|uniref:Uncharacterized protein n=1 Tax=Rubripirellula reticaptiva TaxID=2528013 RepID=A0A5C6EJT9_9BACT|nr:hypothetical protein Poly59_47450 [Rubripirellula reticaptiva]
MDAETFSHGNVTDSANVLVMQRSPLLSHRDRQSPNDPFPFFLKIQSRAKVTCEGFSWCRIPKHRCAKKSRPHGGSAWMLWSMVESGRYARGQTQEPTDIATFFANSVRSQGDITALKLRRLSTTVAADPIWPRFQA